MLQVQVNGWKLLNKFKMLKLIIRRIKEIKISFKSYKFWLISIFLIFSIWFYFCLPDPIFSKPYSTVLEDCNGNFLSAQIADDYQWRFPESDTIPYKFSQAIICFEDEYFYYHLGVNPISMFKALVLNISKGKTTRGGSTISMQTIRLSKNNQKRSILNKFIETILAIRLELKYSKKNILKMYASHAPFGGNIVGVEAASWRYFNRPTYLLSWSETATLAVLPNAPSLVFPGKNQKILLRKRNYLLQKMYKSGIIDSITCYLAKSEPLPKLAGNIPQKAMHLLQKVQKDGYKGTRVKTTLSYNIQNFSNTVAKKYANYFSYNYIKNIAIIVLDTKTGNVLSYVGNVNLKNNHFFVDNIQSKRSSGSILKPMLYAASIDNGLILPNSLLSDIPTRIGGYAPKNYEDNYEGAVPAGEALAHSLNIPFVRLLREFGISKFLFILKNLGFTTIQKSSEYYGLSLILGGAEVTLWEAAGVYASMARDLNNYYFFNKYEINNYRKPSYLIKKNKKTSYSSTSFISAGSLFYTMQSLSMANRPWSEIGWDLFSSQQKIAWKTGTSFGNRDAWAIGVTPEYTVGVWVGNSDGEGRPGLTGLSHASPVMFEIFKYLKPKKWFSNPVNDMILVDVCVKSGYKASQICDKISLMVPSKSNKSPMCQYHKQIFLDSTSQYRVSGDCYPVSNINVVPWFILPPAQEWYYKKNHPEYLNLPNIKDGCEFENENVFDILIPENNSVLSIPKGIDETEGLIIFEAVHRKSNAVLYWHIDDEFLAKTVGIHKIEVSPDIGVHTLFVIDNFGNSLSRKFKIISK